MIEKILLADDHSIVRVGLALMVKKLLPDAIVVQAEDYAQVLKIVDKESFNLIVLDIDMSNGSFQQTAEHIKKKLPNAKILVFSALDEDLYAMRYIRAGADGFLNKLAKEEDVKKALEKMLASGKYLSDNLKDNLIFGASNNAENENNPLKKLSNREIDIAVRLMKGMRLKEISNELRIHVSTISTYKTRIFEKLSIQSVPEMIEVFKFYEHPFS